MNEALELDRLLACAKQMRLCFETADKLQEDEYEFNNFHLGSILPQNVIFSIYKRMTQKLKKYTYVYFGKNKLAFQKVFTIYMILSKYNWQLIQLNRV